MVHPRSSSLQLCPLPGPPPTPDPVSVLQLEGHGSAWPLYLCQETIWLSCRVSSIVQYRNCSGMNHLAPQLVLFGLVSNAYVRTHFILFVLQLAVVRSGPAVSRMTQSNPGGWLSLFNLTLVGNLLFSGRPFFVSSFFVLSYLGVRDGMSPRPVALSTTAVAKTSGGSRTCGMGYSEHRPHQNTFKAIPSRGSSILPSNCVPMC